MDDWRVELDALLWVMGLAHYVGLLVVGALAFALAFCAACLLEGRPRRRPWRLGPGALDACVRRAEAEWVAGARMLTEEIEEDLRLLKLDPPPGSPPGPGGGRAAG